MFFLNYICLFVKQTLHLKEFKLFHENTFLISKLDKKIGWYLFIPSVIFSSSNNLPKVRFKAYLKYRAFLHYM
jgi:hypothetical protein